MKVTGFQPNLIKPTDKAESILEKLASGKKINSAADDAAGLAIINRLTSELDGYMRGSQNAQDGISLTQTADAAYSEVGDAVSQIRDLASQAGSGILTATDRQAIQGQITQLTEHVNSITQDASFGGVDLLNNNGSIGITLGGSSSIDVQTKDAGTDLDGLGLNAIDVTTAAGAQAALGTLENIQSYVGTARSELGASENRLGASIRNLDTQRVNVAEARSRRQDTDFAQATSDRIKNDILQQAQISVQSQSNLNRQQAVSLLS
jgi:flagellin